MSISDLPPRAKKENVGFTAEDVVVEREPPRKQPPKSANKLIERGMFADWLATKARPAKTFQGFAFTTDFYLPFKEFLDKCPQLKGWAPKTWLEVGVYEGRSACAVIERMPPGGLFVGVDCWMQPWAGDSESAAMSNVYEAGRRSGVAVCLLKGTIGEHYHTVRKMSPTGYDGAFIDGSKDYDVVLNDSHAIWSLMKSGAVVVWDDAHWHEETREVDMFRLSAAGRAQNVFLEHVGLWEELIWHTNCLAVIKPPRKLNRALINIVGGELGLAEFNITKDNHRAYADYCEAEHVVLDIPMDSVAAGNGTCHWKYAAAEVAQAYGASLYVDADCVFTKQAPVIFDFVPEGHWGVVDELQVVRSPMFLYGHFESAKTSLGYSDLQCLFSINAGLMVMPPDAAKVYHEEPDAPQVWTVDQTCLSIRLAAGEAPYRLLDRRWNTVWVGDHWIPEAAWVIHRAGQSITMSQDEKLRHLSSDVHERGFWWNIR